MKEKLQPETPNDGGRAGKAQEAARGDQHPLLHQATSGGKKVPKKPSTGPKLEQFSQGLEGEGSPFSPLTQTPLPWALPVSSSPQPCATSSSDTALWCLSPSAYMA